MDQNRDVLTRRRLVHLLAYASTLPASANFLADWLQAADHNTTHPAVNAPPPEPDLWRNYQPGFFNREDYDALAALTEILIPTDDTPGARDAHCAQFIDFLLAASGTYAPELQRQWRSAMARWRDAGFHGADPARRASLVAEVASAERGGGKRHFAYAAYLLVKRENAFAFYTSRAGMIGCLDYRGNSYNVSFPACTHPEHHVV